MPLEASLACVETEKLSTLVPQWYAIHTHARHEKRIAERLQEKGLEVLVPTVREVHEWSDRKKVIEMPLFPCYALIRAVISPEVQSSVLHLPGVFRWIGCQGQPSPIPEPEVTAVRTALQSELPVEPYAFLKVGQRVRIRGGSLDGVEGILVAHQGSRKLVVSVQLLQQSMAISLDGYRVELSTVYGESPDVAG
jgi:transcription antitermination factor NusG